MNPHHSQAREKTGRRALLPARRATRVQHLPAGHGAGVPSGRPPGARERNESSPETDTLAREVGANGHAGDRGRHEHGQRETAEEGTIEDTHQALGEVRSYEDVQVRNTFLFLFFTAKVLLDLWKNTPKHRINLPINR